MHAFTVSIISGMAALSGLCAAEGKLEKDWKQRATQTGLSAAEVKTLSDNKIVVSSQEVKQSFSAYLGHGPPNFITSDAVLNAYHVLFEETLRRQEELQAAGLVRFCTEDWALLATIDRMYTGDTAAIRAAQQRVRFVLGVAVKLLGEDIQKAPESLQKAIEQEAASIEMAEGQHKPALLGPPEPDFIGFDYTVFKPVGFYASAPRLQRYFRALRWLQLVPFRLDHPEELLAFHMLELSTMSPLVWNKDGTKLELISKKFLPDGAGLDAHERLLDFLIGRDRLFSNLGVGTAHAQVYKAMIADERAFPVTIDDKFLLKYVEASSPSETEVVVTNDRIRERTTAHQGAEGRVLSAITLPEDASLATVSKLENAEPMLKRYPGLEFSAWLTIPSAMSRLREKVGHSRLAALAKHPPERYQYAAEKDASKPWWGVLPENWAGGVFHYRAALGFLTEIDPRAPAFMRGKLWELKTLQTVAASWAQERHAWSLQVMPEANFPKSAPMQQGFIEPVPAFFLRMSVLANHLGRMAAETESKLDPVEPFAEEAAEHVKWLSKATGVQSTQEELWSAVWDANRFLGTFDEPVDYIEPETATKADALVRIEELKRCAKRLRQEARPGTVLWGKVQAERLWTDRLWHQLEILCMRLSLLADKQLSNLPFSENEANYIEYIGMELSEIMLYRGQAWTQPIDDAPRITRLFKDQRSESVMHVGIGRPRLMYVLYPWRGREILCRGVVMPYHETITDKTLTDADWHHYFEADTRPAAPDWLEGLVPNQKVSLQEP